MNQGKYIFAQLTDFLPRRAFDRLVEKYSGNKKIRTFTYELNYEKGSYYIMDKGYVDFTRLHKLHTGGAYFVTSAKDNMRFRRMYSREVNKTTGIKCDQIGNV